MKKKSKKMNLAAHSSRQSGLLYLGMFLVIGLGAALTWFFLSRPAPTAASLNIPRVPERSTVPRHLPEVPLRVETATSSTASILVVGDIMLGRYVETLMARNGPGYPFARLDGLLNDHDIVLGNLEGPIDSTHTQTPDNSLIFSFDVSIAALLRDQGFTMLSLANNHTLNQGAGELSFTRSELAKAGVETLGDPSGVSDATVITKILNGQSISFFGLHATTSAFDLEAAIRLIQSTCPLTTFCIVTPHWGNEYQTHSSTRQQAIARALIDAGADAIVGHHPHVVQEVEVYQGKAIFYSLGNFIFDQYFSKETQEELALAITLSDTSVSYQIRPLQSEKSQTFPLSAEKKDNALLALAARSASDLQSAIKEGVIQLVR